MLTKKIHNGVYEMCFSFQINHLQKAVMDQKDFEEKWDITEKVIRNSICQKC
jgi:hypothetical protein